MSDNDEFSKGYDAGYDTSERLKYLEVQIEGLSGMVAQLQDELVKINQRLHRIERPKMSAAEALKLYEGLKSTTNPSLTLSDFAAEHGLSYNTLRQARSRQRRKT